MHSLKNVDPSEQSNLSDLSLAFILGSPRYIISDYKIRTMSTYDKGLFGSVIGLSSIAFLLVLFEIIKEKGK